MSVEMSVVKNFN